MMTPAARSLHVFGLYLIGAGSLLTPQGLVALRSIGAAAAPRAA